MEESSNSPSLSAADSKKWIMRIVLALVLGQAIWGLVVALTAHLLVPLTARVMGGDPASPLYLGKGDIDVPALFIAILEFCLAGIVAAVLNSWVQKPGRVVVRRVATVPGSLSLQSAVAPAPKAAAVTPPLASPKPVQAVQPAPVQPAPVQAPPVVATVATPVAAKPVAPPKPAKPKEVYYNIVGDPITMDDE
jgi:hypothetical protein